MSVGEQGSSCPHTVTPEKQNKTVYRGKNINLWDNGDSLLKKEDNRSRMFSQGSLQSQHRLQVRIWHRNHHATHLSIARRVSNLPFPSSFPLLIVFIFVTHPWNIYIFFPFLFITVDIRYLVHRCIIQQAVHFSSTPISKFDWGLHESLPHSLVTEDTAEGDRHPTPVGM